MVGIAVVSFVLGALLVLVIVALLYRKRKQHSKSNIKRPSVSNATYEREIRSTELQQQQKGNASYSNVIPETEHPKVVKQGNTSEKRTSSKDNIYNHLNEHKDEERDDNFDHAHPIHGASALPIDDGDYTHLQIT